MLDKNLKFNFYYKLLTSIAKKIENPHEPMMFWQNNELISYMGKNFWEYSIHRRTNKIKNSIYSKFSTNFKELESGMDYIIHGSAR
jgi:hypothetical protein